MSNPYWPEVDEIFVVTPDENHPDSVGIRFSYINDEIAPANEIVSVLSLDQMKILNESLSRYIYEIEYGVPEDEKHRLN